MSDKLDKACRSNSHEEKVAYLRENGVTHGLDNELLKSIPFSLLNEYWSRGEKNIDVGITTYLFDKKFKSLIKESMQDIEVSFKQFCMESIYKHDKSDHPLKTQKWINQPCDEEEYKKFESGLNTARYLATKDGRARPGKGIPDYYIVEKMSFGAIKVLCKISKWEIKNNMVKYYSMMSWDQLRSLLDALNSIRNIAAHYDRLWNRDMNKIVIIPKKEKSNRLLFPAVVRNNPGKERKIYNVLVWMIYLSDKINPQNTFKHDILNLMDEHKRKGHNYDKGMGFPLGWRDLDFWK